MIGKDAGDRNVVADSDAERIVAADKLPTTLWSRVARQTVDHTQDPTLRQFQIGLVREPEARGEVETRP
jgi:hypothetical protein